MNVRWSIVLTGLFLVVIYLSCVKQQTNKHLPAGDLDTEFCLIPKKSRVLALPCFHTPSLSAQCHIQEVPPSLPVPAAWGGWAGCCVGSCCATACKYLSQASQVASGTHLHPSPGSPESSISQLSSSQDLYFFPESLPFSWASSFCDPSF